MRENTERPIETFEKFGGFQQLNVVTGVFEGKDFGEAEVKCFRKYVDTGEVEAVLMPTRKTVIMKGAQGDFHVHPSQLKLKFRLGKISSSRFKPGEIK